MELTWAQRAGVYDEGITRREDLKKGGKGQDRNKMVEHDSVGSLQLKLLFYDDSDGGIKTNSCPSDRTHMLHCWGRYGSSYQQWLDVSEKQLWEVIILWDLLFYKRHSVKKYIYGGYWGWQILLAAYR